MLEKWKNTYTLPAGDDTLFTHATLWALIIPLMVEQTLTSLMGVADTLMVSGLGEAAISGVTCSDVINMLVLRVFEALGAGGNVVVARYIGAKDTRGANNAAGQFMMFQFLFSAAVTGFMTLFSGQLLNLLYPSAAADVMAYMREYFRITILSYPFLGVYTASAALYRANGNSKLPVTVISIGNVINVAGNALLIFVFHLGVVGVAWSTFVSRVFSCVVLLVLQSRDERGQTLLHLGLSGFRFEKAVILGVLAIGIPAAIENGMFQLGKIVVQTNVVYLGTSATAAQAILTQLDTFASRPVQAIGFALLTVVGQYIGAKRMDYAKQSTRYILFVSMLANTVTSVLTLAATPWVCSLVSLQAETAALVFSIMLFMNLVRIPVWGRAFQLPYAFKAAGDVKVPVMMTMASMWILRVGGGSLFCRVFGMGLWGIWIAWVLDWVARMVLFSFRFHRLGTGKAAAKSA